MNQILTKIFILSCLIVLASAHFSERVRHAESTAIHPTSGGMTRGLPSSDGDMTANFCVQAQYFSGAIWAYNLCSCAVTAQFYASADYYESDYYNITAIYLPAWNGSSSGGRPPVNAAFITHDPSESGSADILAVISSDWQSCNAVTPFCVNVQELYNSLIQDYSFVLFNRCPFTVNILYLCDSDNTNLFKSYTAELPAWDGWASSGQNALPNNAVASACSSYSGDYGVAILSVIQSDSD